MGMNQGLKHDWRQVQGFETTLLKLRELRESNRLPPVLLFEGHAGIGKAHIAAAVAGMYVCDNASACGECPSCQDVMYDRHADVFWLQTDEDRIKLNQAAELQEHLQYNPGEWRNRFSSVRIAVGIDIDKLVPQAANRLLKTLEEPPQRARIILTTSHYQNLLETIRSRCVKWHLRLPASLAGDPRELVDQELVKRLEAFFDASNIGQALLVAQDIQKEFSLSAVELQRTAELALNQRYRKLIGNQEPTLAALDVSQMQRRRQQLRELRRLADRQQIALNSQLSLESLVLFK